MAKFTRHAPPAPPTYDYAPAHNQPTLTRSWSPPSTPPPMPVPGSMQVNTNGRGAVVWIPPVSRDRSARVPQGGMVGLHSRPPKLMMDPSDRSTWQRPYRFT
jgi:hypothetical protein